MTRTSWERVDLLFRFLLTGLKAFVLGFALWYLLLAINASIFLLEIPRHMDERVYGPFHFFRSTWGLGVIYGSTFFFATMLVARSRRSCCPALAAFIAYAVFVIISLPQPILNNSDFGYFLLPLLTAPVGGWLGVAFLDDWTAERRFVRFRQCKTRLLGIFSNLKSQIDRLRQEACWK